MIEAVSCSLMKKLDQNTITHMGIPSLVLMERAALKTAEEIEAEICSRRSSEKILCVCGSGNNGGDGIAAARILFLHGYQAEIFLAGNPDHMTEETRSQLQTALNYHVPVVNNPDFCEYTTIVDAVFGIGLARPVEGKYKELIQRMNQAEAWKVAADIPSGVNGNTGEIMGAAFQADLTVTYAFLKKGLCLYPGRKLAGRVSVADIGIYRDPSLMEHNKIWQDADLKILPKRVPEGNKGTFGKVLAVAGSQGMCGAAYLCAAAAFAVGAGMVRILTEQPNRIPLQVNLPEAMIDCGEDEAVFEKAFHWCDVLIIGPGLGCSEKSRRKVQWFLEKAFLLKKRVVLDADGLNLLAENPKWKKYLSDHVVVTPHIGEMSRLTGKTVKEIQGNREKAACDYAALTGTICVLKDACTVTADPGGNTWFNLSGNPGMATAGSGDVLSGILSGVFCMYLTQDMNTEKSCGTAALGVFIHGRAGDLAAKEKGQYGMKAGDLIPAAARVMEYGGYYEKI